MMRRKDIIIYVLFYRFVWITIFWDTCKTFQKSISPIKCTYRAILPMLRLCNSIVEVWSTSSSLYFARSIHWYLSEDGIMLIELFVGIGIDLATILEMGLKIKCCIYIDIGFASNETVHHHQKICTCKVVAFNLKNNQDISTSKYIIIIYNL